MKIVPSHGNQVHTGDVPAAIEVPGAKQRYSSAARAVEELPAKVLEITGRPVNRLLDGLGYSAQANRTVGFPTAFSRSRARCSVPR